MKQAISILLAILCFMTAGAQKTSIEDYIQTYRDLAIQEMKRTGVPAAIKLAQGIHETEGGNSDLLKRSNNHFGIKCKTKYLLSIPGMRVSIKESMESDLSECTKDLDW